jgi:predicted nucleic acid-binding protein
VLERLLQLLAAYPGAGKQVHDANLVAAMLVHGVGRLLTFNATDFQRFAGAVEIDGLVRA